jgi:hypothetical protein
MPVAAASWPFATCRHKVELTNARNITTVKTDGFDLMQASPLLRELPEHEIAR